MPAFQACPFCRALFTPAEVRLCPECEVALVPMEALPPSLDRLADEAEAGEELGPDERELPTWHWGHGRGVLLLLAVAGACAFFLPWVTVDKPDGLVRSGFSLARGRAGWLWGGLTGWVVLLPLVWTRRSLSALRGIRLIAAILASLTFFEGLILMLLPPQGHRRLPVQITWETGLYLSCMLSLVAAGVALYLGRSRPAPDTAAPMPVSSNPRRRGRALH